MAKHLLVVLTNAVSKEREGEFNDWYTNQHVHDVVKVPGFIAATRYVAADSGAPAPPTWKYLALYEVETDDLPKTMAALNGAAKAGQMPISGALDAAGVYLGCYTAMTERVTRGK